MGGVVDSLQWREESIMHQCLFGREGEREEGRGVMTFCDLLFCLRKERHSTRVRHSLRPSACIVAQLVRTSLMSDNI